MPDGVVWMSKSGKKKKCYLRLYCGFDIETYTIPESHKAYMYIWQFSIYGKENYIVYGRFWSEFVQLIEILKKVLKLSKSRRIIIFDFNFGFEFQFIKCWFKWSKIFAKEVRKPLFAFIDDCVEFRDAQSITGGSLAYLAKNYTETQKAVGDLDYSIVRTPYTPLTDTELGYCFSDVAILAEFSKYIFDTYIEPEKWVPLTKTGFLRREVKKGITNFDIKREIYRCYPQSYHLYSDLMTWCFRGGYTHANLYYAGRVIEGVKGRDITSSYPYVMIALKGFPVSPLKRENPEDFQKLYNDDNLCLMFRAVFVNIRAKTDHSYESSSKCISLGGNAVIDNGRVRRATLLDTWLTEIDMRLYNLFYEWDEVKILYLYSSVRGYLPKYLVTPMANAYAAKCLMKREGKDDTPEYANQKALVNSAFGLTCQKLVTNEVKLSQIDGTWFLDSSKFDYEKERKKAILLPQWGIYVCALARERICTAIYFTGEKGHDALYSDTDSIKYVGGHEQYFEMVNDATRTNMKKACERLNLDFDLFYDLGSFDKEYGGREVRAKFLGAKRYIIEDQGKPKVTIAGLPKGALENYCKTHQKDIFETFEHGMLMNVEVSLKKAHSYNDEPHEDIIDGVPVAELSSVGIYPIDFTMKLNEYYLALISHYKEVDEQYEKRIY